MNKSYKVLDDKILYLNTEANCTKTTQTDANGIFNVEFSWNIPSITIDEFAKLKVFSMTHEVKTNIIDPTLSQLSSNHVFGHGDNVLTFRLKDVLYNPSTYYSSDNTAYPLIWSGSFFENEPMVWNADLSGITIIPQTINKISLVVSDLLSNPYAGIYNTLGFLIGISIQQYDLKLSEINNPYK